MRERGDYKKLPTRCGVDNCKTRLFYVEDGQWFCKHGHRREGDVELELDDDFGIQLLKKVKRTEEKRDKKKIVWTGRKGYNLFLSCYQGILKEQVKWLIEKQGLPVELEEIVRDLWNLRLRGILEQQNIEISAEGIAVTQEGYSSQIDSSGYSTAYSSQVSDYESEHSQATQGEYDNFSQKRKERREKKRKRRKLASQEINEKKRKRLYKPPLLLEAIAICYLGTLCLNEYIPLGDFKRWMENQELLYFRATNALPTEMKKHLHGTYHMYLDPRKIPFPSELHRQVQDLSITLHTAYNLEFPACSVNATLVRYGAEFGFPPEIIEAAKTMIQHLQLPTTWPMMAKYKQLVSYWPEVSIMSALLVCTKLAFGLDGIHRTPRDEDEIAANLPDLKAWEKFLTSYLDKRGAMTKDGEVIQYMRVTEDDIMKMKPTELDAYMDWYEKNWGDNAEAQDLPEQLLDLFPRGRENYNPPSQPPSPIIKPKALPEELPKEQLTRRGRKVRKQQTRAQAFNPIAPPHQNSPTPSPEPDDETNTILENAAYKDDIRLSDTTVSQLAKTAITLHNIFTDRTRVTPEPTTIAPERLVDKGEFQPRRVREEVVRPGQNYTRFHHDSDLPRHWKLLVAAAAELIDVTEEDLRKGITSVEVKVEDWARELTKGMKGTERRETEEERDGGDIDYDEMGDMDDEGDADETE